MQSWGVDRHGQRRYRCFSCQISGFRNRPDLTQKSHEKLYHLWLTSKQTLTEFASQYQVTRQTLDRWFKPFRDKEILPHTMIVPESVFIIDGYYVQYGATVLIAQTPSNQIVGWSFTYAENFNTWLGFFNSINSFPMAIVCDGQKGMLKAIKLRFPGVIIQRCQFHVIHHVNLLLTKHPETLAAKELKRLVNRITKVKTEKEGLRPLKALNHLLTLTLGLMPTFLTGDLRNSLIVRANLKT